MTALVLLAMSPFCRSLSREGLGAQLMVPTLQ
jgi:hypothetical protein